MILLIFLASSIPSIVGCTVFSVTDGEDILIGRNYDFRDTDAYFRIFTPGSNRYGYIAFGGSVLKDNPIEYMGGMNDQGLVIGGTAIPHAPINYHPENLQSNKPLLTKVIEEAATVAEAVNILTTYRMSGYPQWSDWGGQRLIADKTGEVVSVSVGSDGELHFCYQNQSYHLITNFNLADPSSGNYPCPRYDTASEMLATLEQRGDVTIEDAKSILESTHNEGGWDNTIYSSIFDPIKGEVYLFHFHQYEEVVKINLQDELEIGENLYYIPDLFTPEIVDGARTELQNYRHIFWGIFLGSILLSVTFVSVMSIKAIKTLKLNSFDLKKKMLNSSLLISNGLLGFILIFINGFFLAFVIGGNYFTTAYLFTGPTFTICVIGLLVYTFFQFYYFRIHRKTTKKAEVSSKSQKFGFTGMSGKSLNKDVRRMSCGMLQFDGIYTLSKIPRKRK